MKAVAFWSVASAAVLLLVLVCHVQPLAKPFVASGILFVIHGALIFAVVRKWS